MTSSTLHPKKQTIVIAWPECFPFFEAHASHSWSFFLNEHPCNYCYYYYYHYYYSIVRRLSLPCFVLFFFFYFLYLFVWLFLAYQEEKVPTESQQRIESSR